MATGPGIEGVGGPIGRLFGEGSASGMDEGELLRRFAGGRDPVALEVLVARHGPMVLGVCRRVLGDRHSSEDAFQATFLVLARKAGSIRDPARLGPWLHGVAHRVAVRARADLARRNARERPGAEDLAMESTADDPGFDRQELRAALDEEVRRLPEKFRDPIVLCYLDGLTHDEAATRLRCPVGTVRSRLSTGRARLRDRLARRGMAVPSGVFATVLAAEGASASVSPSLLMTTVKAATAFAGGLAGATAAGMVSAGAASLAEGVSKTMIVSKLKIVGGVALAGMLTLGVGGVAAYQIGGPGQDAKAEKAEKPAGDPFLLYYAEFAAERKATDEKIRAAKAEVAAKLAELQAARDRLAALQDPGTHANAGKPAAAPLPKSLPEMAHEASLEVIRLQWERDRVLERYVAAQKRLEALNFPNGVPKQPEPPESALPVPADRVELEETRAELVATKAQLERTQADLKAARAGLADARMKNASAPASSGLPFPGMGGGGMGPAVPFGSMSGTVGLGGAGVPQAQGKEQIKLPKPVATLQSDEFVIVQKPGTGKVDGYSTATGEWASYAVPNGLTITAVWASGVVALAAKGDEVRQIATYAAASGKWYPIDLKEPAKAATPVIGPNQAVYPVGRFVYAFSGATESWDVLELPEGAKPVAILYHSRSSVEHGDHLYIFSVKTGMWSDFDAKAGQVAAPKAN